MLKFTLHVFYSPNEQMIVKVCDTDKPWHGAVLQVLVSVLLPGHCPVPPAEQLLVLLLTPSPQDTLHALNADHNPQPRI